MPGAEDIAAIREQPSPSSPFVSLKTLLVAAAIVLFAIWMTGAFDKALVGAGLNKNDCAVNGLGQTMCGNELDAQQSAIENGQRELRHSIRCAQGKEPELLC